MYVSPSDFVMNGEGHGPVGSLLSDVHFDTGMLRPFFDAKGRSCVLANTGQLETRKGPDGQLVCNSDGTPKRFPVYEKHLVADLAWNKGMTRLVHNATVLSKEQWVSLSNIVRLAFRQRLRAWSDLQAAASYGGFDGMSTMALEYQTMSDPGEAAVDFDGMTEGRADQPQFKLEGLPLPIIHCDFFFPERMLAISRKNGTPLNARMAEAAGRRVGEMVEKHLIGTVAGPGLGSAAAGIAGLAYGRAAKVYGYTNHPARVTKTDMTDPSGTWSPDQTVTDVLTAIELLRAKKFFGPFMIYNSTDWDQYLDGDYYKLTTSGAVAPSKTLRQRLREIDEVKDVRRLDYMDSTNHTFTLVIVQMTSDVVQAVNGMDVNTIQWPSMGGMRTNFKVMAIQAPLITPDYDDNCGIAECTIS